MHGCKDVDHMTSDAMKIRTMEIEVRWGGYNHVRTRQGSIFATVYFTVLEQRATRIMGIPLVSTIFLPRHPANMFIRKITAKVPQ